MSYITWNGKQLYNEDFDPSAFIEHFKPKLIFDIGSFDGGDSIRYAEMYPDAHVYALEADPDIFAKSPKHPRVTFINAAVSDFCGDADFYQCKDGNPSGSLYKATELCKTTHAHIVFDHAVVKTKVFTVKSLCEQFGCPDFIHMDVQGAAFAVTKGFGKFRPKLVLAETNLSDMYHGADRPGEVNVHMSKMGYDRMPSHDLNAVYLRRNSK